MPHDIFDALPGRYDRWYDDHRDTYRRELELIGRYEGVKEADLEIGVGTGRFAAPLGIRLGIDPSRPMLRMARARKVEVIQGRAEALPLRDQSMRSILVMTSLCYFDDPVLAFREISRVLVPGGRVVIGFLGRGGEIAEHYRHTDEKGTFLTHATFYTPKEVARMLAGAGLADIERDSSRRAPVKGFHVMIASRPVRESSML
jgi:ubiquinone/menaquinone biosynthesis C-methylase UbiE